jgi:antitoxin component HigA of HigAB toxin-antitoxin module
MIDSNVICITDTNYKAALARVDALMNAEPGTPEINELEALINSIMIYEEKHFRINPPTPEDAACFRKEQESITINSILYKITKIVQSPVINNREIWHLKRPNGKVHYTAMRYEDGYFSSVVKNPFQ